MLRALLARLLGRADDGRRSSGDQSAADEGPRADADPNDAADAADGDQDVAEGPADGDDAGSVWDLIPSWQYDGRHVETGGLTRDEQEQALADIQAQADAIERGEDVAGDLEDVPDER